MLQAIFATVLISIIILPIPLVILIDKRHKRKALKSLLHEFSSAGSHNGLSFSSQEVLRNSVIGLDGLQRKLLVVERKCDNTYQSVVIDLNEVQSCTVDREYKAISRGDSAKQKQLLESISLFFTMTQFIPIDVVFYNYIEEHALNAPELEAKARHWQVALTKLLTPPLKTA